MLDVIVAIAAVLALIPFALGLLNLLFYQRLRKTDAAKAPISVLVPARNEEDRIRPVIESILANKGVEFELLVADDNSTDNTASIIQSYADKDDRLRLIQTPPLPDGWKGKNHACHILSQQARHDHMVFLDADITVSDDALVRLSSFMTNHPDWKLISGFPRQITGSFWEKLVIPLIHFVLLGFLPMPGMRHTKHPMFGTACGQLIAVQRDAYEAAGGHEAIRASVHDGVRLPRGFRALGFHTDLIDPTDISATRMYENTPDLIAGLRKNAHEGMATPVGLPVWTTLLAGGQILPVVMLIWGLLAGASEEFIRVAAIGTALSYGYRFITTLRFRQSWLGALLHPLGIAFLLWIQWTAFFRHRSGVREAWKDRTYD